MQPGSIVVCIDDSGWREMAYKVFPRLPIKGRHYTVRRIIPNIDAESGFFGIALFEIRGESAFFLRSDGDFSFEEYHFRSIRFRLLPFLGIKSADRKKSIFNKIFQN